ncbi:MAG: hypothetical protein KKD01_19635 [Proteobacteria bacterium]|nr:hypothetical protein [Pseudomonadota bacterium]
MSNGSGTNMICDIIDVLDEKAIFLKLTNKEVADLLKKIKNVAENYDCNTYSILGDEFCRKYKICMHCFGQLKQKNFKVFPICHKCYLEEKEEYDLEYSDELEE